MSCLIAAVVAAEDPFAKAEAVWERDINRPPLLFRLRAMRAIAKTGDPRAIRLLAARYQKPRLPKDHERYQLARVAGDYLKKPEHAQGLWAWASRHKHDEDSWLWFNAMGAEARNRDVKRLTDLVQGKGNVFVRAATLEALGAAGSDHALDMIPGLLSHTLLAESCAGVLYARRSTLGSKRFRAAAEPVIELLSNDGVPDRTKLTIARRLAGVFGVETVSLNPLYWKQLLYYQDVKDLKGPTRAARPNFFGIEGTGKRIAYVIDMSDSMTKELTPVEKAAAEDALRLDLDWGRIRSRFDLARACLVASLGTLTPDVSYVLIGFGKKARMLRSTKGLVKATRNTVAGSIRELRGIKPGKRPAGRAFGTLWGETNLHAAMLLAYRLRGRKVDKSPEHVRNFRTGIDTMFILSDGAPTDDDYGAIDKFGGGTVTTDRETKEKAKRGAGSAFYMGPYRSTDSLLRELDRLNLFRKVEVHCIAMGEASSELLRRLAERGLGRYRSMGRLSTDGFVRGWWIIGPFDAKKKETWADEEFPEKGIELKKEHAFDKRKARWKRVRANRKGYVNLDSKFRPRTNVAAYAFAEIYVGAAQRATLHAGSDDGMRVWLNGKLVHSVLEKRKHKVSTDQVPVQLEAGVNRLLVKVCELNGAWGFSVRINDAQQNALSFVLR